MKKLLTKLTAALLVCFTVFTIVPASVFQVQAAAPKVARRINAIAYPGTTISTTITIQNKTKKGKITDIKVEDTDIAEVNLNSYGKEQYLMYTPKKAGKTTVSFKYAGKKLSTTIYVEEWENPCKKFLVGTKDYKKTFDKSGQYNQSAKKNEKKKIKVEAAKGWKLLGIYRLDNHGRKKVKNNSKILLSTAETGTGVGVIFQNKKTKKKELLYFGYGFGVKGNVYNDRDRIESDIRVFEGK